MAAAGISILLLSMSLFAPIVCRILGINPNDLNLDGLDSSGVPRGDLAGFSREHPLGVIPGQINERFNVTVENGSAADLDLATLIVKGSTTTGDCVDIFDGDNQMEGAPTTPLAPGASAKFSWGLSCPGKGGEEISVTLSNGVTTLIEVAGKLA